jgi:biopolymer transport protein ExbB
MFPILFVSLIGWYIGIEKLFFLNKFYSCRKKIKKDIVDTFEVSEMNMRSYSEEYRILISESQRLMKNNGSIHDFALFFKEFLLNAIPKIDNHLTVMSAWISVAPLLGLLGTVSGMIKTFQVITDYGLGNPNLTAEGISIALITTQAGLTVAFPLLIFHNHLRGKADKLKNYLFADGEEMGKRFKGYSLKVTR